MCFRWNVETASIRLTRARKLGKAAARAREDASVQLTAVSQCRNPSRAQRQSIQNVGQLLLPASRSQRRNRNCATSESFSCRARIERRTTVFRESRRTSCWLDTGSICRRTRWVVTRRVARRGTVFRISAVCPFRVLCSSWRGERRRSVASNAPTAEPTKPHVVALVSPALNMSSVSQRKRKSRFEYRVLDT